MTPLSDDIRRTEIALCCTDITIGYGGEPLIKDLSFQAKTGELTALVGPNGCGKSTLLKTLARLLTPTKGRAEIGHLDVHQCATKDVAKQLAFLPQGPIAPEGLSVLDLVAQGRFPHQSLFNQWSKQDEAAVHDAMVAADVAQFADHSVAALSGGQRQRCWIAMVLAQETPVLLLDEPTTFLDLKVQVDLMKLLKTRTRKFDQSVVIVLHDLNIAAAFADHLVMMRDGSIVTEGAVEEVYTTDNLRTVFDLDANVITDNATGNRVCVPHVAA